MRKKHNNELVLKLGSKLFREQGFNNTGTEEILEKADYPRSSFYYHFKSKEGFGVKALEYYGSNLKGVLEGILTDESIKSPTERLKKYFYMIADFQGNNSSDSCCLVQRFSFEDSGTKGVLRQTAYEQFKEWVQVASKCIQMAQKAKELRSDLDVNEMTEFLFSMIYGGTTLARLSHEPTELRRKMELAFRLIEA